MSLRPSRQDGHTALYYALQASKLTMRTDMVDILKAAGAIDNTASPPPPLFAPGDLALASMNGNLTEVNWLLSVGAGAKTIINDKDTVRQSA